MGVKTPNALWQSKAPSTAVLPCSFGAIWFLLKAQPNLHSWIIPVLDSQFKEAEALCEWSWQQPEAIWWRFSPCGELQLAAGATGGKPQHGKGSGGHRNAWSERGAVVTFLPTVRIDFQLFLFPTTGGLVSFWRPLLSRNAAVLLRWGCVKTSVPPNRVLCSFSCIWSAESSWWRFTVCAWT